MRIACFRSEYPVFVPLLLALAAASSPALGYQAGAEPARLLRAEPELIQFEVNVPQPTTDVRQTDAGEFRAVRIPGFFSHGEPGEAELPHRTFLIGIPAECEYEVSVAPAEELSLGSMRILPAPFLTETQDGSSNEKFIPDEVYYASSEFRPAQPLLGVSDSWMRQQRVLSIDVCPVRYNPASGAVVLLKKIVVTVTLRTTATGVNTGDAGQSRTQAATAADGLESMYRLMLLNYEQARQWRGRLVPMPVSQGGDSFGSSSNWCKISVEQRGMYRVTGTDLMAAGVTDLGSINPLTLRLFNGGGLALTPARNVSQIAPWMKECAIRVFDGGDGRFDSEDYVLFYGMGVTDWLDYFVRDTTVTYFENEFTDRNVYWLTWNGTFSENPQPRRLADKSGQPVTPGAYAPASYRARVHVEQNREYDPSLYERGIRWEKWWWATLSNPGSAGTTSFLYTFKAPQAEPSSPCSLAVRLWAPCTRYADWCSSESHTAAAVLNRRSIDGASWVGFNTRMDLTGWSPASQETDSLVITVAAPRDDLYLAWYELFYQKRFAADPLGNNSVTFSSPDTSGVVHYSVSGLGNATGLLLLDVTDYYSPRSITGYQATEVLGTYTVEFEDTLAAGQRRQYLLINSSALKSAASVSMRQFARRLRDVTNGADYVIVAHKALAGGVGGLANLRESNLVGIADPRVFTATTEEIFDEFSWGLEDPCAIRDFLMYAYWNWSGIPRPLSYVLMAGDATYDFKDYYNYGSINLVPTWEGTYDQSQTESQLVNDDFFVLLDGGGDKLLDACLGRITFQTPTEENAILNGKIVPYATSSSHGIWRNKAILVADDNTICRSLDPLGYDHIVQTELISNLGLPDVLDPHKIYLTEFRYDTLTCYKSTAKAAFTSDFSEGALIINYIGHGNWNQLAHEQVFQIRDVASLSNAGKLALFFAGSCKVAKFDEPFEEGLGEALLKSSQAGAVASVSATGLVYSWSNYDFNMKFYSLLFPDGRIDSLVPIGVALMATKNYLASFDDTSNARKYVLMGDPALVLATPELGVRFDAAATDTLRQGEVVTVSGEVTEDGNRASWYEGTADVLVSGDEYVRRPASSIIYTLPGGPIFHGTATVRQGEFDFSFVVPTDSTVVGPKGRVRGYSMDSMDGAGIVYPVVIQASTAPSNDTTGPVVALRFDGGAVYVTSGSVMHVMLSDEHGISATGASVNNSILLQIDKSLQPVDLTANFMYSPDSYQSGVIDYTLPPLSPGPHSALLVCHDNLGNRGSGQLDFHVVESGTLALKDVLNYPNPFEDETYVTFELTADATATIKIYSVSGTLVRKLCEGCPAHRGNNQFRWDGRDSEGHAVANGVYLYFIEVRDAQGKKDSFIGRAALLK